MAAVRVPVIGNGDILFPHEIAAARARSGCAGVMVGRAALIKPWIFQEAAGGYRDVTADERLGIYGRYVDFALEHWGADDHGRARVTDFTRWHFGFWCRYAPQRADGSFPTMQGRDDRHQGRTPLERLLARGDAAAHAWLTERLVAHEPVDPAAAPEPGEDVERDESQVAG